MKDFLFREGMQETMEFVVSEKQTARYLGSGKSDILATPALVMLMEAVSQKIIDNVVPDSWQSVGSYIELRHDVMTPCGAKVEIQAVLSRIDGRELMFMVSAWDESGMISRGIHKRILSRTEVLKRLLERKK